MKEADLSQIWTYLQQLESRLRQLESQKTISPPAGLSPPKPLKIPLEELVDIYNDVPRIFEEYATPVSLTADSYRGKNPNQIVVEISPSGNYWILLLDNPIEKQYLLVLNPLRRIRVDNKHSINLLFDLPPGFKTTEGGNLYLDKPAVLKILPSGNQWLLQNKGILTTSLPTSATKIPSDNRQNTNHWQEDLKSFKEEVERETNNKIVLLDKKLLSFQKEWIKKQELLEDKIRDYEAKVSKWQGDTSFLTPPPKREDCELIPYRHDREYHDDLEEIKTKIGAIIEEFKKTKEEIDARQLLLEKMIKYCISKVSNIEHFSGVSKEKVEDDGREREWAIDESFKEITSQFVKKKNQIKTEGKVLSYSQEEKELLDLYNQDYRMLSRVSYLLVDIVTKSGDSGDKKAFFKSNITGDFCITVGIRNYYVFPNRLKIFSRGILEAAVYTGLFQTANPIPDVILGEDIRVLKPAKLERISDEEWKIIEAGKIDFS